MTTQSAHILLVDDEDLVRSTVRRYLVEEGFRVTDVPDGAQMRRVVEAEPVDLVLLDLRLPDEDGLSLARYLREHWDIPIIMLTGRSDLIDRVAGLEAGADDYISKPFHLRELLARIRTVLRRAHVPANGPATAEAAGGNGAETLVFDQWRLDRARRELWTAADERVPLTTAEFDLLWAFVSHPNRVLERDQLMTYAKGRDWAAYDRTIDAQVMRLRRKIERDAHNPEFIKTVRGVGYIFTAKVDAA